MVVTLIWFALASSGIIIRNLNERNYYAPCSTLSQNVFGECVRIRHLSKESDSSQRIQELGFLHRSLYVAVRRTLEEIALVASRCILVCSPLIFSLSLLHLVLSMIYKSSPPFSKQKAPSRIAVEVKKKLPRTNLRKGDILSAILLLMSSVTILSVALPLSYELYYGGALSYQLSSFNNVSTKRDWLPWPLKTVAYFSTAFIGEKHCTSGFELFDFRCLRNSLFDLDASGIKQAMANEPETLHEKLCLQIHISNLNCTAFFVWLFLYTASISVVLLVFKVLHMILSNISNPLLEQTSPKTKLPINRNHGRPLRQQKHHPLGEHYEKKCLKAGGDTPWREVKFSSDVQPTDCTYRKVKGLPQKSLTVVAEKKKPNRTPTKDSNQDQPSKNREISSSAGPEVPRTISIGRNKFTASHSPRSKDRSPHSHHTDKPSSTDNAKLSTTEYSQHNNIKIPTPPTRDTNKYPKSSRYLLEPVEVRKPIDTMLGSFLRPEPTNVQQTGKISPISKRACYSRTEPVEVKCSSNVQPIKVRQLTVPRIKTPSPIGCQTQRPVAYFGAERTPNSCGKVESRMAMKNGVPMLKYLGRNVKEYY